LTTSPLSGSFLSSVKTIVELDSADPAVTKYHNYLKTAIQICLTSPLGHPKLAPPHLHAVNTLMNIPCVNPDIWFPQNDFAFLGQLLQIFEESFKIMAPEKDSDAPDEEEIFGSTPDQALIPICLLLKKLTIIPDARKKIKDRILPSNIDRTKPLSEGPMLTAALFRAMTSVRLHQTKDFMCDLMVSCFEDNGILFSVIISGKVCPLCRICQRGWLSI
jgi:Guanine nucleotide exchange factor synembryn